MPFDEGPSEGPDRVDYVVEPTRTQRRRREFLIGIAVGSLGSFGYSLLVDGQVDGAEPESTTFTVVGLVILLVIVGFATLAVRWLMSGLRAMGTSVGLLAVVLVILEAGASFAIVEAEQCVCEIGWRHGTAQATWLAFDTVPILKINETLGWEEPQPLSAVAGTDTASDTPLRRWLPALAVRFAVGFVLLAIAKGLFDLVGSPHGADASGPGVGVGDSS